MLSYAAVSTCFALGATATPFILTARDAVSLGPWCDAFGTAGIDVVSNFTLAARNVTSLPSSENVSMEDVLLVLGAAGVTAGAELKVLTTYESYPYNDYRTFSLLHGLLSTNGTSGSNAINADVTSGYAPAFLVSKRVSTADPAQIYCGVAQTDPDKGGEPRLGVHGDADSFSLCRTSDSPSAMDIVVYNATRDGGEYVYDTCHLVELRMAGL